MSWCFPCLREVILQNQWNITKLQMQSWSIPSQEFKKGSQHHYNTNRSHSEMYLKLCGQCKKTLFFLKKKKGSMVFTFNCANFLSIESSQFFSGVVVYCVLVRLRFYIIYFYWLTLFTNKESEESSRSARLHYGKITAMRLPKIATNQT